MDTPTSPTLPQESPSPGQGLLIVQGGSRHGACQTLRSHLTLLGQSPGCDVRLNVEQIAPLHCALFHTPSGVLLRDVSTKGGIRVNDQSIKECLLRDGDQIQIGPFRFLLKWTPPNEQSLPDVVPTQGELEALRIQASAVAAQQAQLVEQESRLEARRIAQEKQQQQLADHLEERRRELVKKQDAVRQERTKLKEERKADEKRITEEWSRLEKDQEQTAAQQLEVNKERDRLRELRQRLQQRADRHWKAKEKELGQREKTVAQLELRVGKENEKLAQDRLQFTGESELKRREIQAGWAEMKQAQRDWREQYCLEHQEVTQRKRELEQQISEFHHAQRIWASQCKQAEITRTHLEQESLGLEIRIHNLREQLIQQTSLLGSAGSHPTEDNSADSVADTTPTVNLSPEQEKEDRELENRLAQLAINPEGQDQTQDRLQQLAQDLIDERHRLMEQWGAFYALQETWQQEHHSLLPSIEELAQDLEQREAHVVEQEQHLLARQKEINELQEETTRHRFELQAREVRIHHQLVEWKQEHQQALMLVEEKESIADHAVEQIQALRERWRANRREEVKKLREALHDHRRAHAHALQLADRYQGMLQEIQLKEQTLAERSLALEQLQIEAASHSESAAATDRRLQKLEHHWAVQHTNAKQELRLFQRQIEGELQELQQLAESIHEQNEHLVTTETDLLNREADWEHRRLLSQQAQLRQEHEAQLLQKDLEESHRQAALLREELDQLVSSLIRESNEEIPLLRVA